VREEWVYKLRFLQPSFHNLFRAPPKLLHLHVARVLFRQRLGVPADVERARALSGVFVQQQADGRVGSLAGRADEGAEEQVGQRVEPHVHGDDVRRHDARVGSVDHDAPVADALGQVDGEEGQCQLGVAVDGDAPEAAPSSAGEEVGEVQVADGVGARHHVDHAAARVHQRKQLAGQQVGPDVVDADRTFQSVFGDVQACLHRAGAVHEQGDGLPFLQENVGKLGDRCQRGEVELAYFYLQILMAVHQRAAHGFGLLLAARSHDDTVAGQGHGTGDFGAHAAVGSGDDGQTWGGVLGLITFHHGRLDVFLSVRFLSAGRAAAAR